MNILKLDLVKKNISIKILYNLLTKFFLVLTKFLISIVLAKFLGPTGKGITYAFQSISGILTNFSNFGIDDSIVYNNNRNIIPNDSLFFICIFYQIIISVISFFLLLIVIYLIPNLFIEIKQFYFQIFLYLPLLVGETLTHACLKSLKRFKVFNILSLISRLNLLILLFITLYLQNNITFAINVYVAVALINLIISYIVLYFLTRPRTELKLSKYFFLLNYGIKVHFGTVLTESEHKLDIYFILFLLGAYELGIYSIALAIGSLAIYLPNSITTVLFPYTSKNEIRNKNLTKFSLFSLLIVQSIFFIFLIIIGKSFISFFYGIDFLPAYLVFLFLIPAFFFDSLNRILLNFFKSKNKMFFPNFSALGSLIINILLLIYLIPMYGILGAAISTSISYTIKFILLTLPILKNRLKSN